MTEYDTVVGLIRERVTRRNVTDRCSDKKKTNIRLRLVGLSSRNLHFHYARAQLRICVGRTTQHTVFTRGHYVVPAENALGNIGWRAGARRVAHKSTDRHVIYRNVCARVW